MCLNTYLKTLLLISALSLCACNRPDSMRDTLQKSNPGQSGDEGIQRDKSQSGDEGIQGQPINPNGNPAIIIPPPIVNMPADIVPDKPAK